MKVSIVIPNYNGKESLLKNLPRVLETGVNEVILVDDASIDGSVKQIKEQIAKSKNARQKVKILENKKNLGFSSTVNKGVEEATGDIVVLLNTDVSPETDFLKPLVAHFSDSKVFAVGCMDKSIENGKVVLRGRGLGRWYRGFLVHRRGEVDKLNTLWVAGGSGAFRKSLWHKLGGFDPLYNPFYWEDIDLSYRAQKSGHKILFEPKSQVTHKHEEGAIKKNFSPFYIKTIAYRNQFFFVWKNITDKRLLLSHFFWLSYHLARALFSLDLAFWLGFFLALLRLPWILSDRWRVSALFVKSDREVINQLDG